MLPQRMNSQRQAGRKNIPLWMMVAGVAGVLVLGFVIWVTLGIGDVPAPETVTVDVPVSL